MSLTTATRLIQVTTTTVSPAIPVTFKFYDATDLTVLRLRDGVSSTLINVTDYAVTGGGSPPATGTVTINTAVTGDVYTIYGDLPFLQEVDLSADGPLPTATIQAMVERLTMYVQQLSEIQKRTVRLPLDADEQDIFPLALRASALLGFDADGNLALVPNEGTASPGEIIRTSITSFVGGLSTSLNTIPIADLAEGTVIRIQPGGLGNPLVSVQVVEATDTPSLGAITRPDDYDAVTNPKQYFTIG